MQNIFLYIVGQNVRDLTQLFNHECLTNKWTMRAQTLKKFYYRITKTVRKTIKSHVVLS